jgi:MoxR-like ATPase
MNGLAGIGKSTIARTVAEYAKESGLLGSTFFFVRQHDELSNAKLFLGTIVRDFAKKLPKFGAAVAEALKKDDKLSHASLATQYSSLLFTPLKVLKLSEPLLLIIDALDECKRDEVDGVEELLHHLILGCSGIPGLHILITS